MSDSSAPALPCVHRIDPGDDVAIALADLAAGSALRIDGIALQVEDAVPRGHKVALTRRSPRARRCASTDSRSASRSQPIRRGQWVHTHNLRTALAGADSYAWEAPSAARERRGVAGADSFQGYRRADGRVGTRNEIWILCTVGCVARTARRIAEIARARYAGRVDGIHAFTHPLRLLAAGRRPRAHPPHPGRARDPSQCRRRAAARAGLRIAAAQGPAGRDRRRRPRARARLRSQQADDEVERGRRGRGRTGRAGRARPAQPCALADLVVGLKCGGSDGFSGHHRQPPARARSPTAWPRPAARRS